MCLISFQWHPQSDQVLTLVANRDEFHARAAQQAHRWADHPHMCAGKDLSAGGTWMGVTTDGHFAALTNVRQLPATYKGTISRGQLVSQFLQRPQSPLEYARHIFEQGQAYDGFNLIVGNRQQCVYVSNRSTQGPNVLQPGIYGLCNAQLDTPWPKLAYAKEQLNHWLEDEDPIQPLHQLLHRRAPFHPDTLPDTGVGAEWEHLLSSPFIVNEHYGTRASTALSIRQDSVFFAEASFDASGQESDYIEFEF